MKYIVKIEGQEIELPEEIAAEDGNLKSALSPYFPGAANAKFMRSEPKDEVITVTVIKQAGTKGGRKRYLKDGNWVQIDDPEAPYRAQEPGDQVLRRLIEAHEGVNPVVELDQRLKSGPAMNQATFERMVEVDSEILDVLEVGDGENRNMVKTFGQLRESSAQAAPALVPGF